MRKQLGDLVAAKHEDRFKKIKAAADALATAANNGSAKGKDQTAAKATGGNATKQRATTGNPKGGQVGTNVAATTKKANRRKPKDPKETVADALSDKASAAGAKPT